MTNETVLDRRERLAREVVAKIDAVAFRSSRLRKYGETTMSKTSSTGWPGDMALINNDEIERRAADGDPAAEKERLRRIAAMRKSATEPPFDPQREPAPPKVLTLHEQMAAMSDIDLARLATEAELPTVNTNSSEDFQRLADGRAARAEIFKRALRKPIPMPMGAV
jgi:hypothetical protein